MNAAQLTGYQSTVFGWGVHRAEDTRSTNSLMNFPMQAHGAEMLRIACSLATERGIEVCAPIHDAVLVEGDAAGINDVVAATQAAMAEASAAVLDGVVVPSEALVVRYPERYMDKRGRQMWHIVTELTDQALGPA